MKFTRRSYIRNSVATLAAAGAGTALPAPAKTTKTSNNKGCFYLCELLGSPSSTDVTICRQVGVNNVIASGGMGGVRKEQYVDAVKRQKDAYAAAGMKIVGVEGHPVGFDRVRRGVEGRDDEIENTKWAIEALARNGIDMICYNFMAGYGWTRTNTRLEERGGALTAGFSRADFEKQPPRFGEISEEKMWENCEYAIRQIIPVAEKFKVKMALHPDDPPLSPLNGVARIVTSKRNYERIMAMAPSPYNGVTFCQANFLLMKEDIYSLAREWCNRKKIFFIHFRDVDGDKTQFHETFHDNGPTDMIRMLEIYSKAGFVGPIRPDHAPMLAGESGGGGRGQGGAGGRGAQNAPAAPGASAAGAARSGQAPLQGGPAGGATGYTIGGKVLAFGYMKGIMDALGLKYA